jgi:hypothetical protein
MRLFAARHALSVAQMRGKVATFKIVVSLNKVNLRKVSPLSLRQS